MKRFTALLLSLVMMLSSVILLASCNEEEAPDTDPIVTPQGDKTFAEGDIFEERAAVDDELPEYDFEGRTFRIAGHKTSDFYPDPESANKGNLIVDAMVSRTTTAENRFNFVLKPVFTGGTSEVADWVSKTVLSGSDEFDLLVHHVMASAGIVSKNLFLNWYDIPNVDFSKPWWAASTSDELTYDGKCIFAISDFNYSAVACTYCLIFNKNLANSYDLGNLYEVVESGDWTYDYFYDLIKDVYTDNDGDGEKSAGDFYGMIQGDANQLNQWLYAFDNPIMRKNEEGVPTLAFKSDKINNIIQTLYDYCFNTQGVCYGVDLEKAGSSFTDMFLSKKGIFGVVTLGELTATNYRNFDDEYGILPLPKFNEAQDDYHTLAYGEHTILAVPKTVKDTEFVGTCIEALSAESYKQVIPTFYEIALKTRYLRDNESKKMLDIIINNRLFDFGYVYDGFKGFAYTLNDMFSSGSSNFESYYSREYTSVRSHFKVIIKAFDKLS
ncbi:MAG: hypothetical protein IJ323_06875 [Clostridia bacterium]|nr:hypothetical protein [Clostridia bacterium]